MVSKGRNSKIIAIMGPTASGKTALSMKLAKEFNGEIVSADSRQIYKGMDIGTAKPIDLEGIPHHLLDIITPEQPYAVGEYKKAAVEAINGILSRNKLPLLCGGTGLYLRAVTDNLDIPEIQADAKLRQEIEQDIEKNGLDFVFKKLVKLDPEAAYIIDPKNPRRVVRALEVTLLTKKPFSQQRKIGNPLFEVLKIGVLVPNEELKKRINNRIDQMMQAGLVDEVKNLLQKYGQTQALDAIGYREIIEHLKNPEKISLEKAIEDMKLNTWHYAKRQMTWFRKEKNLHWVSTYEEAENLAQDFLK